MSDSFAPVDVTFCINAQGGRAASILMYCSLLPASEIFLDGRHKDIPIDRLCSPSPRCRPDQFLHLAPCLAAVRAGSFGQLGYFAPRGRSRPCGPTSTARSRWHSTASTPSGTPARATPSTSPTPPATTSYYVHGRTVFDVMVRITDDIFNTYIRKTGTVNPYYSEYCDGKSVTCRVSSSGAP